MKIAKDYLKKPKRDPHLHSPAHVLADELANKLGDPRHFGFYLKMATEVDHNVLRKILGEVLEGQSSNPGALFAFLLKKFNREKSSSSGYSVWLLPDPAVNKSLAQIIQSLAQTFDSPVFEPHVTLLGGLENENIPALEQLSTIPPFIINLKAPTSGDAFFTALHLPVIKNKEVLNARRLTKKAFGISSNQPFNPHLSLLYANLPAEQKLEAAKSIILDPPKQLTISLIALVKTTGRTEDFKILKTITLTPPKPK